jgi:hypothetical protein
MSEMDLLNISYAALLSLQQQHSLSQEALRLYEFVFNRAKRKDATEISTTNVEAISRARCHPAKLQSVQSEIHRSGLLLVEELHNPRHQPHEIRTKYTLVEQEQIA